MTRLTRGRAGRWACLGRGCGRAWLRKGAGRRDRGEDAGGLGRGRRPRSARSRTRRARPSHLACPAYVRFSRPSCPRETYLSRVCPLSFARSTQSARRGGRCLPRAGATALGPRRRSASRTSAEEAPPWGRGRGPAHAHVTQILPEKRRVNYFLTGSMQPA